MPNIFFTSDTHYGHKNIIGYSNRPFANVEEMNEKLIELHNSVVQPEDTVYHLGDFGFGPFEKLNNIVKRLNGIKHLIFGNHDRQFQKQYNAPTAYFSSMEYYHELRIKGKGMFILFHYGMRVWDQSHHGSIMLHGHSHGSLEPHGKSVDVGVDANWIKPTNYKPIHIDEIVDYMRDRPIEMLDHHGPKTQD